MRIGLLSLPEASILTQPIAGRSLPFHQLDLALAAGCERILVVAPQANAAAFALQTAAEREGARFQVIADAAPLPGLVKAGDELLVLDPRILPQSSFALAALADQSAVFALPATDAVEEGFERIDRERAWAGIMFISGRLVSRMAELPRDADVPSALLRIAMQSGAAIHDVPSEERLSGRWSLITDAEAARRSERRRFSDLGQGALSPSLILCAWLARSAGNTLLKYRWNRWKTLGLAGLFGLGAMALAWFGWWLAGFAVLAAAWLVLKTGLLVADAADSPLTPKAWRWPELPEWMFDGCAIALAGLAARAVGFNWIDAAYATGLVLGLLRLTQLQLPENWGDLVEDRTLFLIVLGGLFLLEINLLGLQIVTILLLVFLLARRHMDDQLTAN